METQKITAGQKYKTSIILIGLFLLSCIFWYFVLFAVEPITGFSPFPFNKMQIENSIYYKDRFGRFYSYFPTQDLGGIFSLLNVDKDTFQVLSTNYAKDKYKVFSDGGVISGADPATFQFIPHNYKYVSDKTGRYIEFSGGLLGWPDEDIQFAYDRNFVYLYEKKITSNTYSRFHQIADFILVADNDIISGNPSGYNIYKNSGIDIDSLRVYSEEFLGDKNYIYCRRSNLYPLTDLDVKAFKIYQNVGEGDGKVIVGDGRNNYAVWGDCTKR